MNRISLTGAVLLALYTVTASAVDHTVVAMANRTFNPPTLSINVGDTVTFMNEMTDPGFHNVDSDTNSVTAFRCANGCDGAGGDGDPSGALWTATVTFPTAGTAPFHCEIHGADGGGGMSGTITVVGTTGSPAVTLTPTPLNGTADEGATTSVPLAIGNTGDADLNWTADTASTDCATPDTVPWLSVDPTSGTVATGAEADNVSVLLDATTLTPGVYNANVCVSSNDPLNALVAVPVAFTVGVSAADFIFSNGFEP